MEHETMIFLLTLISGIIFTIVPRIDAQTIVFTPEVCTSLDPEFTADPQTTASPFTITPSSSSYTADGVVTRK